MDSGFPFAPINIRTGAEHFKSGTQKKSHRRSKHTSGRYAKFGPIFPPHTASTNDNRMKRRVATDAERRYAAKSSEFELEAKGVASLEAVRLALEDQIQRSSIRFRGSNPTVSEWKAYINRERIDAKEPPLSQTWQYGFILWSLLDGEAKHFFNSFHAHRPTAVDRVEYTAFSCPYVHIDPASSWPTDWPDFSQYQTGRKLDFILQGIDVMTPPPRPSVSARPRNGIKSRSPIRPVHNESEIKDSDALLDDNKSVLSLGAKATSETPEKPASMSETPEKSVSPTPEKSVSNTNTATKKSNNAPKQSVSRTKTSAKNTSSTGSRQLRSRHLTANPVIADEPIATLSRQESRKTRWTKKLPVTEAYYYDEDVPVARLVAKSSDFPPRGIDMSDAWVVKVIESDFTGKIRGAHYPAVFDAKGGLRHTYTHKGRAAKCWSTARKCYVYQVAFNKFEFFGAEGTAAGLSEEVDFGPYTIKGVIEEGSRCVVQSLKYDPSDPTGSKQMPEKTATGTPNKRPQKIPVSDTVTPGHTTDSKTVTPASKEAKATTRSEKRKIGSSEIAAPLKKPKTAGFQSPLPPSTRVAGILSFPDPPTTVPVDQNEEEPLLDRIKIREDIIQEWVSAMRDAQGKLVMTANALERSHASLAAMSERLRESAALAHDHLNNPSTDNASALRQFLADNTKIAREIVESVNIAATEMNIATPTYANRIFEHGPNTGRKRVSSPQQAMPSRNGVIWIPNTARCMKKTISASTILAENSNHALTSILLQARIFNNASIRLTTLVPLRPPIHSPKSLVTIALPHLQKNPSIRLTTFASPTQ